WRYRDYVIAALNADKPFDRFVREQIAGDLLPAADAQQRAEQQLATGFLAIGAKAHSERNPLQFEMDLVDEQIDVLSQAFLGLTVACARCHDHKFDPIAQKDYYALAGVFSSSAYREAPLVPADVVERYDLAQKQVKEEEQKVKKFLETEAARLSDEAARQA